MMRIVIELADDGELSIDTGEDELSAAEVNAFLDVIKTHLVVGFMRSLGEESTTPEDEDEVPV